ncbi:MAG: hypothetical protein LBT00_01470 [Spirochaetaceae bacterium]|nr:hypothetical protein [Spirochaetaceae bacterium]
MRRIEADFHGLYPARSVLIRAYPRSFAVPLVIASEAKQSRARAFPGWIASPALTSGSQ